MDDMEQLRVLGGPDPVPDPAAERRARAALLTRALAREVDPAALAPATASASARRGRRRWVWRIAAPVAAAAAAIGVLGVVRDDAPHDQATPGPTATASRPAMRPVSAVQALGYAADAASQQPFTMPRPDQWLYLDMRYTTGSGTGGLTTGGPYTTERTRAWWRIDGTQFARRKDGKLVTSPIRSVNDEVQRTYPYETLAALPPDPAKVLAWVRKQVGGVGGGTRDGEDQIAFGTINGILRENLLPPRLEAAFFQALARLSDVQLVPGAVNVDGRPALAVARVQEGWLREEILLDPATYRLIGERAIAIADHRVTADDGSHTIRKATIQRLVVRDAATIVDRPGES